MVVRRRLETRVQGEEYEMKWILILMTWYGDVPPMTQDIEVKNEVTCERMVENLRRDWKDAPREFVYITDCREAEYSD